MTLESRAWGQDEMDSRGHNLGTRRPRCLVTGETQNLELECLSC